MAVPKQGTVRPSVRRCVCENRLRCGMCLTSHNWPHQENDWNKFVVKTNRNQTFLLLELCLLVRKPNTSSPTVTAVRYSMAYNNNECAVECVLSVDAVSWGGERGEEELEDDGGIMILR